MADARWSHNGTILQVSIPLADNSIHYTSYAAAKFVSKDDRLYVIEVTIDNLAETGTGSKTIELWASYAVQENFNLEGLSSGPHTFRSVQRADNTGRGALDSVYIGAQTGIPGDTCSFDVIDVSVKEIDHGSNVDGVKYFPYTNLNYQELSSNVVSTYALGNIQPNADFGESDTSSAGTDNSGWEWPVHQNSYEIVNGQLNVLDAGPHVVVSKFNVPPGVVVRFRYTVNDPAIQGISFFGSTTNPVTAVPHPFSVGTHEVVFANPFAGNTSVFGIFTNGAVANNIIQDISVEMAWRIPEDELYGFLPDPATTNQMRISEDDGSYTLIAGTRGANGFYFGDMYMEEFVEDSATTQHILSPSLANAPIVAPAATTNVCESIFAMQGVGSRNFTFFNTANFYVTQSSIDLNFDTGVVTLLSGTPVDYGAYEVLPGSGVWRLWIVETSQAVPTVGALVAGPSDGTGINYAGDGTSSVFYGGLQVEYVAEIPSSYIQSIGGSATLRNEDLGIINAPRNVNGGNYTLEVEAWHPAVTGSQFRILANIYKDAANDTSLLLNNPTQGATASAKHGSISSVSFTVNPVPAVMSFQKTRIESSDDASEVYLYVDDVLQDTKAIALNHQYGTGTLPVYLGLFGNPANRLHCYRPIKNIRITERLTP